MLTFHPRFVCFGISHKQCGSFSVEWVCWIWVAEELGKEDLEYVDHVKHWRPGLVDDVEANRA